MKLYAGIDLHSNNSYMGIIDENGGRVFKRKVRNDPELIVTVLIRSRVILRGSL